MKVVYCYITAEKDGSKVHIDNFLSAFRALGVMGVDAGVVTSTFVGNKAQWSVTKRIWAKLIWLKLNLVMFVKVFRHARNAKADVLIFRFMSNHQLFIPIFVLSFLYPVVLEVNAVRAIENPIHSGRLIDLLDRITFWRSKRIFVVSRPMQKFLLRRYQLRLGCVSVIENGVNVNEFVPEQPSSNFVHKLGLSGRFVVGFVGTFKSWHGVGNILDVAEQIVPLCPEIVFLIVGDGPERPNYEAQVADRGLSKYFVFTGFVPHEMIREYLCLMDVAMAPHRSDSFQQTGGFHGSPLKIFEYMAMGKAIIATPIGQIAELIVDGQSGRLIYAENTEAMIHELLLLNVDSDYRRRLGVNARKRVETHYTWKVNAEKVRSLCREAIECHD